MFIESSLVAQSQCLKQLRLRVVVTNLLSQVSILRYRHARPGR